MEENNRQRASDNANEPLAEVDLTAVTSTNEDCLPNLVQTGSIIELLPSTSSEIGLLSTYHNGKPTFININSVNVTGQDKEDSSFNSMSVGCERKLENLDECKSEVGKSEMVTISEFSNSNKLIIKQDVSISSNLNAIKNIFNVTKVDESNLLPQLNTISTVDSTVKIGTSFTDSPIETAIVVQPLEENSSIEDILGDPANKTEDVLHRKSVSPVEDVLHPESVSPVAADFKDRVETNNGDVLSEVARPPEENETGKVVLALNEIEDDNVKNEERMIVDSNQGPVHNFDGEIKEITGAWEEFQLNSGECFTKGCKWSPDGTCLLTNSDDNVLRIFDLPAQLHCQESWPEGRTLPEMRPALRMAEGGLIYDYCWYPLMSSWDPLSCCLVSTAQDNPVHLWDAFTGALRATYRAYNQVDEVEAAHCVVFDHTGDKLYCGFKNVVRIFNTAIPGRNCQTRYLKDANIAESQRGIVSCIAVNPATANIYAVGSYLKSVGLYSEPHGSALCLMSGHGGGVTHLVFSPDGTKLFSGARKDAEIICWDIRNPGHVLHTMERKVNTNQRILFDVTPDGRYLVSGNSDGAATVWDLLEPPVSVATGCDPLLPPRQTFTAHKDCVNGVSIHQQYPIIATSSGQRHFAEPSRDSSDSDTDGSSPLLKRKYIERENCIKLWWTGKVTV